MQKAISMKLKKGDTVIVIAGKEKGRQGQITKVNPVANRIVINELNMVKKATKPNTQTGEAGGFVSKAAAIHASNVMLIDPITQKPTRKRSSK